MRNITEIAAIYLALDIIEGDRDKDNAELASAIMRIRLSVSLLSNLLNQS